MNLPKEGRDKQEILAEMERYRTGDIDYKKGKIFSLIYDHSDEHTAFLKKAYTLFFSENGLNPMAFESLKRFESEVVRMTAEMLHGDSGTVGTLTSGGTESCMLAVKTYRDRLLKRRPWIRRAELIVPESIHVAFEKGADYFGVRLRKIPLDGNYRVDVSKIGRKINRRTAAIVASAPSYPHGVVDPIPEMARLARERHIPLHVDSCLGGFLLPFVEQLGYPVPQFDFRVPGVTSISADIHKYGFGAKGASVILYRDIDYLKHQFFISENWPGGIFASPALLGTRPGGAIAAAWAALQVMGAQGFLQNARVIMDSTTSLIQGIENIPELAILGKPNMSVLAYRSVDEAVNIYAVAEQMEQKGWHIDRLQRPAALHAMITPRHRDFIGQYIRDLKDSVEYVKNHPGLELQGNAATYGMIAKVPFRGMIKKQALKMMMDLYGPQAKSIDFSESSGGIAEKLGKFFIKKR